jgi:hypothetical protein
MKKFKKEFLIKKIKAENNKLFFIAEDNERNIKVFYDKHDHHKIRAISEDLIKHKIIKKRILEIEEIEQLATENRMREFNLISISDIAKSDIVIFKEKLLELNPFFDRCDCHAEYIKSSKLLQELEAEARNSEIKTNLLKKHLCN